MPQLFLRFLSTKTGRYMLRSVTSHPLLQISLCNAREQSRLTCELCSYSPAFLRVTEQAIWRATLLVGAVLRRQGQPAQGEHFKAASQKPLRAPDTIIIKR